MCLYDKHNKMILTLSNWAVGKLIKLLIILRWNLSQKLSNQGEKFITKLTKGRLRNETCLKKDKWFLYSWFWNILVASYSVKPLGQNYCTYLQMFSNIICSGSYIHKYIVEINIQNKFKMAPNIWTVHSGAKQSSVEVGYHQKVTYGEPQIIKYTY